MISLVTGTSSRGSGSGGAAGGSLMVSAATTGPVDYNDLINKPSIPDLTPINDFMDLDFGLLSTSRAPQNKTGIFIPFYVYPNFDRDDFKKTFDDMMQILDENQDVPVLAVINPGNGPLDAGVYDSVYEILLSRLKNHNVTVMGYVKSGRDDGTGGRYMGNRPIADVETDIVDWFTYFPTIQGIFVDEAPYLAVGSADSGLGRDQTQQDIDNYLDYYNSIYRLVKTKSRSMLKRFVTVTINPGVRSAPYYTRSIYQHAGDITQVCFDQIMCSENFDFPNLGAIEGDTSATSEIRFDRSTRIAVVHSQPTYDNEKVKKLSKYWGWVYVTSNLMPNPFDDLSKVYFKEMCQTFADDAGSKTKLVSDKPNVMGNKVVQVAAGYNHTMFLMADGTVKGVGDNSQGQLGDGTTINRTTPVSVIQVTGKVTKVAVGNQHTLFLKSDRTVTCLGHSDLTTTSGLDSLEVIDIAAGFHHSVFLCHELDQYSQRTVKIKAMGDNQYGQLGNATNDDSTGVVNVTVPGDAGVVTKVVAGDYHTVFLTSASGLGKAYAVGRGLEGQTGQTSDISTMQQVMPSDANSGYHYRSKFNVHDIEAGGNNTVLICTDPEYEYESGKFRAAPTVVTLGDNAYYQLGVNNTEWQHQSFVQRAYIAWADNEPRAIHASVGNGHMLVQLLDSSGTIKAFGRNTQYQLADGTNNNNGDFVNEATGLTNVVQVAAGNENSMFLLADGTVKCIGNNSSGQLGVGSTTGVSSLTDVLFDHRHLIGDNVGIGTVSPTEKLHVNGDVRADNVKVNNVKVTGAVLTMSTDHTFKVTVADKENHRYPYVSGSTSNSAYYIDGIESPFLQLVAGKTYKFDVSGIIQNHPLGLYESAGGGSGVAKLSNPTFTATNDVHTLETSETTPATFFYMCELHPYMGNQIHVAGGATGGGGSGSLSFVELSDTPSSLGTDGQVLKVVSGNLQFANESGGGSGSGGSPVYAHLQVVLNQSIAAGTNTAIEYRPIDSGAPLGLTSYSVGGITLSSNNTGIKFPSNGDYKMDFNIIVRDSVQAPGLEYTGYLYKGSNVIGQTRTFLDQVDGYVYAPLPLTAIVQVTDYTSEEYFFKVTPGHPDNIPGEVHGWLGGSSANNVEGSQVTIMKVSDMGGGGSGLTNWAEDANGHILPNTTEQYDLGSADKKVRHLFLSDNSIYMGTDQQNTQGAMTKISLDTNNDVEIKKGDNAAFKVQPIVPNPATASSGNLTSLQIGDTTYTIPSGGSGSGSGGVSTGFKVHKSGTGFEEVSTNTAVLFDETTTNAGGGNYTAGIYTIPVTGYYNIFANFTLPTVAWCGYANDLANAGFYTNYDDGTQCSKITTAPGLINLNGDFNTATGIFTCSVAGVYQVGVHLIGQSHERAQIGIYKNDNLIMEIVDVDPPNGVYPDMGSTIKMELAVNDTLRLKQIENNSEVMFSGLLIKSGIDYRIQKSTNSGATYTELATSSDKPSTSIVEYLNQNDLIRVISGDGSTDSTLNFEQGLSKNSFGAHLLNSGGSDFKGLLDTPNTMTAADAGKAVRVNSAGNALEYTNPDAFPSVSLPTGVVKEYICEVPTGQTITLAKGNNITLDNVTGVQISTTDSYVLLTGSTIGYVPPDGTNYIIYEFDFQIGRVITNSASLTYFKLQIDGTDVPDSNSTKNAQYGEERHVLSYRVDATNWGAVPKVLRIMLKRQNSDHTPQIHKTTYPNTGTDYFSAPLVSVKAIGAPATFTTANPLLANPSTADKGKIVTVNGTGDALEYGANFRELACEQTLITNPITINNGTYHHDHWLDLASHNTINNINTLMNTETKVNVSQNAKVEIKAQITFGQSNTNPDTPSANFSFAIRLGKKVNGSIVWGNSSGYVSTTNSSGKTGDLIADEAQTDPKGDIVLESGNDNAIRAWNANIKATDQDHHYVHGTISASYIDEDPTNGQSGNQDVTYFIRVVHLYQGTPFYIGRAHITDTDRPTFPTILSATEIGSGAITSFTQEQALAGAGGTLFQSVTSSATFNPSYPLIPVVHNNKINNAVGSSEWTLLNYTNAGGGRASVSNPFIAYEFAVPQIVTSYRLWPVGDGYYKPKGWELRASTDSNTYASSYTLLDSQSDQEFTTWSESGTLSASDNLEKGNLYHINTVGAFKYFVLHFTAGHQTDMIGVGEWALYGGGFTIPSQVGHSGKILKTNGTSLKWEAPVDALLPAPEQADAGKIVTVNSTGNDLEYTPLAKQIVSSVFSSVDSFTASTNVFHELMSVNIVPTSANSKFHLTGMVHYSGDGEHDLYFHGLIKRKVMQGASTTVRVTEVNIGTNTDTTLGGTACTFSHKAGYESNWAPFVIHNVAFDFLDSDWSSGWQEGDTVVYSVHASLANNKAWHINRSTSHNYDSRSKPVSTFTAQEC